MDANWNADELNLYRNHPGNANADSRLRVPRSTLVEQRSSPDNLGGAFSVR
ncbi:hypothetical protein HY634_01835 [Candidatus Uhrbacteria bacterium]|nr:hypothetical protein [Candidatus Uhrbacteria bacterium]